MKESLGKSIYSTNDDDVDKTMLLDLYVPIVEPQLKLWMQMGGACYCEKAHLLRHRSKQTCASAMYYQMNSVAKSMQCKTKMQLT